MGQTEFVPCFHSKIENLLREVAEAYLSGVEHKDRKDETETRARLCLIELLQTKVHQAHFRSQTEGIKGRERFL